MEEILPLHWKILREIVRDDTLLRSSGLDSPIVTEEEEDKLMVIKD